MTQVGPDKVSQPSVGRREYFRVGLTTASLLPTPTAGYEALRRSTLLVHG